MSNLAEAALLQQLTVRYLGMVDYTTCWEAMQQFTNQRDKSVVDEIWLLQHPAVFTQGQAGKAEHILAAGDIPVIQVDRGGQVTYHGPGQLVAYLLVDLKRRKLGVRELVTAIESALVHVLSLYNITASPRADAPGVYISKPSLATAATSALTTNTAATSTGAKIAQLGLRVRRGCSFHGLSLNIDMDMEPFQRINPCGYAGMEVTSMALQITPSPDLIDVSMRLVEYLKAELGYTVHQEISDGLLPV